MFAKAVAARPVNAFSSWFKQRALLRGLMLNVP
jgi:hypothetical protein